MQKQKNQDQELFNHLEGLLGFVESYTKWTLAGIFLLIGLWWLKNRILRHLEKRSKSKDSKDSEK